MALPFFYIESFEPSAKTIELNEDTSRHVVQVLRMKEGENLNLTDGKGNLIESQISEAHKKHCIVQINSKIQIPNSNRKITIAISLLKNTSRFELFLEKATEIGINEIIPLICERTEKQKFRYERMKQICISAMLQSQQAWLPELYEPQTLDWALKNADGDLRMIAHCTESEKKTVNEIIKQYPLSHYSIFIGPEGDFTPDEVFYAGTMQCFSVTLGETRLRTETAGVVAATLLKMIS